ncbi:MAG: hypothetical protein HYS09_03115 [Chloroflexi bacterium]|nr:hypothetical protein [Chloroflexota bacterium]
MPAKGFMETFVDLAAFGIDVTCPGFSNLVFKTRASDELNSELKDDSESTINISKCSLRWEKRDDQGALQGGATFSVDGADANNDAGTSGDDGPFYCQGDTTDPVTVVDNGLNDSDPAAGKILLDNACFGTYTITETVAPPGFARDKLLSRTVTVSAGDPNAEIGTSANDCADSNPDNEEDFCNRLGTLSWEKRSAAVAPPHPLLGGATFKIDGADANNDALTSGDDGPFRCQDTDTTNDLFPGSTIGDEDDPALLIVDDTDGVGADSVIDKDPDAGQIKLERVCLGTYTVTETAPPGDFLPDTDPTRVETVSDDTDLVDNDLDLTTDEAEELNAVIGTAVPSESSPGLGAIPGTDDHSGAGGTTLCTNNSDECDFHNRRGSLIIRKEAKDARTEGTHDLLAGAKFRITPDPLDGVGTLDITDDLTNDVFNSTGGVICIDNVIPRTDYSIVELESFTIYKEDSSTKTNVASSSQSCAGRTSGADPVKTPTTVSPDALFTNIPLSKITVSFESLVATGVTKARIECKDKSGTIVPTPADGTLTDFDDTSEVYTGLVPNDLGDAADIYTCTIKIDP